jgi:phosphatidylglycerophosphatase A
MKRLHHLIATGVFSGYFPKAPGTFSTLIGILLFYPIHFLASFYQLLVITFFFFVGLRSSSKVENEIGTKDPGIIVIDEILGIWIALFLLPLRWEYWVSAFLLFRFFDIQKPLFIRTIQSQKGGLGIMLDDFLAGVYTNLLMQLIHYIWPLF